MAGGCQKGSKGWHIFRHGRLLVPALLVEMLLPGCAAKAPPDLVASTIRSASAIHTAHFVTRGLMVYHASPLHFQASGNTAGPDSWQTQINVQSSAKRQPPTIDISETGQKMLLWTGAGWSPPTAYQASSLRLLNPAIYLLTLRAVRDARLAGTVKAGGARLDRIALRLDLSRAASILRQADPGISGFARGVKLRMHAWVDATSLQLQRLQVTLQTRALAFEYRAVMTLSRINSPPRVIGPVLPVPSGTRLVPSHP